MHHFTPPRPITAAMQQETYGAAEIELDDAPREADGQLVAEAAGRLFGMLSGIKLQRAGRRTGQRLLLLLVLLLLLLLLLLSEWAAAGADRCCIGRSAGLLISLRVGVGHDLDE